MRKINFRSLKKLIAVLVLPISFFAMDIPLPVSAETVTRTVYVSEWNAHLADHSEITTLYYGLLDAVDDEGNRIYPDEFIIGFLANVEDEGTTGVVEYAFSRSHAYEFALPSGSTKIRNLGDIYYLLEWPITDDGTTEGGPAKGSCGVSSVQWSYARRIKFLEMLRDNLEGRYDVTEYDISKTDLEMVLYELEPGKRYYREVMEAVGDKTDVETYAEALCDRYFKPKKADFKMNATGDACKSRRKNARELWKLFNSEEMVYKDIAFKF